MTLIPPENTAATASEEQTQKRPIKTQKRPDPCLIMTLIMDEENTAATAAKEQEQQQERETGSQHCVPPLNDAT
jgi:hypothetical protein